MRANDEDTIIKNSDTIWMDHDTWDNYNLTVPPSVHIYLDFTIPMWRTVDFQVFFGLRA